MAFWDKVSTTAVLIAFSALALAAQAVPSPQTPAIANVRGASVPTPPPSGNSPVKIVGGSMTFRALDGWTLSSSSTATAAAGPYYTAAAEVDTSFIQLDGVLVPGGVGAPTSVTIPYLSLTAGWQIEVDAYKSDMSGLSGNGIYVCPAQNPTPPCATTPRSKYVVGIVPINATSSFYATDAPNWQNLIQNPNTVAAHVYQGKRYHDTGCTVMGTFCEHIAQIIVTIGYQNSTGTMTTTATTYVCPDGECRVSIGAPI